MLTFNVYHVRLNSALQFFVLFIFFFNFRLFAQDPSLINNLSALFHFCAVLNNRTYAKLIKVLNPSLKWLYSIISAQQIDTLCFTTQQNVSVILHRRVWLGVRCLCYMLAWQWNCCCFCADARFTYAMEISVVILFCWPNNSVSSMLFLPVQFLEFLAKIHIRSILDLFYRKMTLFFIFLCPNHATFSQILLCFFFQTPTIVLKFYQFFHVSHWLNWNSLILCIFPSFLTQITNLFWIIEIFSDFFGTILVAFTAFDRYAFDLCSRAHSIYWKNSIFYFFSTRCIIHWLMFLFSTLFDKFL